MGKFSDSFWRRTGHIAGNWAGYSIFGDKGADARRHIVQNARADAMYERELTRSKIANDKHVNAIDAAVLRNVDAVIGAEFSSNPDELAKHLMDLVIQLKTNSFKARNEEQKVRTKYTLAVLTKVEQGVDLLERINPIHPRLNYILWQYLKAKWRKIFSLRIVLSEDTSTTLLLIILLAFFFGFIAIMAYLEDGTHTFSEIAIPALIYTIAAVLSLLAIKFSILGLCMLFHKIKRNYFQKQILAYEAEIKAQETAKQKAEEEERLKALEMARLEAEANAKKKAEEDAKKKAEEEAKLKAKEDAEKKAIEQEQKRREEEKARRKMEEEAKLPKMQRRYNALWQQWGKVHPILERGYRISINEQHKDVLILGFNCQLGVTKEPNVYRFPIVEYYVGDRMKRMLVSQSNNLVNRTTYMELFGYKEEDHIVGMQNIVCNPEVFGYVAAQISLSQEVIEDIIIPKLIITLNKDIWAFMGKIKGFTWMGYEFKTIKSVKGFELCEITGFSKAKDRISQDTRLTSNLVGTKVLFADGLNPDYYPTADEILEILQ